MGSEHYSTEQIGFLKSIAHLPRPEMAKLFNEKYNEQRAKESMQRFCSKHKLLGVENTGRLKKGRKTWNKGVTGYMGSNKTSFKKGGVPHNTRPLWSERVCSKDGFVWIKVSEPNGFVLKHHWVWSQAGHEIPKGSTLCFKDGDKSNCALDNLVVMTRSELLRYNQSFRKIATKETNESCLMLGKIRDKLHKMKK